MRIIVKYTGLKKELNILIYSSRERDLDITERLLHGMRITAPPQQRAEVSYFNRGSVSPEMTEPFCFGCGLAVYFVVQVP